MGSSGEYRSAWPRAERWCDPITPGSSNEAALQQESITAKHANNGGARGVRKPTSRGSSIETSWHGERVQSGRRCDAQLHPVRIDDPLAMKSPRPIRALKVARGAKFHSRSCPLRPPHQ
ncbi:hypothetical protein FJTKL_05705 [Diaporthe vaccinii]|uniref:Uncharacterized protein n=1 Tax=Diaporthe vaccinii TaxID=105482 RepID=A0ABR4DRG7_9PEZI